MKCRKCTKTIEGVCLTFGKDAFCTKCTTELEKLLQPKIAEDDEEE